MGFLFMKLGNEVKPGHLKFEISDFRLRRAREVYLGGGPIRDRLEDWQGLEGSIGCLRDGHDGIEVWAGPLVASLPVRRPVDGGGPAFFAVCDLFLPHLMVTGEAFVRKKIQHRFDEGPERVLRETRIRVLDSWHSVDSRTAAAAEHNACLGNRNV